MESTANIALVSLLAVATASVSVAAAGNEDWDGLARTILGRYRDILLAQPLPDANALRADVRALRADGAWPDIDYEDGSRSNWEPATHLRRLTRMAVLWAAPGHPLSGDKELLQAIERGLDHWIARRYKAPNWWFNEIGVPRAMRDMAVLLGDELQGDRRRGALEVINQLRLGGTGANLMWSAELALHSGCLAGDRALTERAARAIHNEIVVGKAEGVQSDWSFFQHGSRMQAFAYGGSYLDVAVKTAWQLVGTPLEVPEAKRDIVSNYILDGLQWMVRGTVTVPSTLDRTVSRKDALRAGDLRSQARLWIKVDPRRKAELERLIARQDGKGDALTGFRQFPRADFTAYHRPGFSFFVKTVSSRTLGTEAINGENLKGVPHLSTGDHYLMRSGEEYFNLAPVWDWSRLPGVTHAGGAALPVEKRAFVGGLGDGTSGLCAMDYARGDSETGALLAARKLWVFHGDIVLCLLGGWECRGLDGEVATALEQCRLRGPVTAAGISGKPVTLAPGQSAEQRIEGLKWVLHDGVGYLPLGEPAGVVRAGDREGTWQSINRQYPDTPVSGQVFSVSLIHGARPAAGGFVIAPGVTAAGLEALAADPPATVLCNDRDRQAVVFRDGTGMAAFYTAGEVRTGAAPLLAVDVPCLAFWSREELRLCDPTHKGGKVTVAWRGASHTVVLPAAGQASVPLPRVRYE